MATLCSIRRLQVTLQGTICGVFLTFYEIKFFVSLGYESLCLSYDSLFVFLYSTVREPFLHGLSIAVSSFSRSMPSVGFSATLGVSV